MKGVRIAKGVAHAINEPSPDQGGSVGSSLHWWDTGELSTGGCGRDQEEEGAAPGDDPWVGALV